jgi:uncharacterized protein with PIN domain
MALQGAEVMHEPPNADDLAYIKDLLMQIIESNKQISQAWRANHDETHRREHEAREKAEHAVNARLEGMNELRSQISQERGLYLSKEQYDDRHEALQQRVTIEIERVLQRMQVSAESMDRRLTIIEHAQTTLHATTEYAKSQNQSALVKWGIVIAVCNLGMAVLINIVLKP